MNKLAQYRLIEKSAVLFTKEHLITILDHTVGPGITDRGALELLVPTAFEKTAYRSAKSISIPSETAKGGLLGGLMFTPYGMQAAGSSARKMKKFRIKKPVFGARRKAFLLPVAIGAGLGAMSKGLMARSDKNLIRSKGRKALKVINIREREGAAATRGQTRGLIRGTIAGSGMGMVLGKALSKSRKLKRIGALSGAVWGGSLAGLAGSEIGKSSARRKFQRKNIWKY